MKQINPNTVENLIKATYTIFPDWSGFLDPRFDKEEIGYKKNAVRLAHERLQKSDLERLISEGQFEEIRNRLMDIAQASKLLFLSVPMKGDMSVVFADNLDQSEFYQAFIELLYGSGKSSDRLDAFSDYLTAHNLPNKWTFPTFFLFLLNPETDMYVKPMTTKWFLEMAGISDTLPNIPNGESYDLLLDACQQIKDGLSRYQPRDLIDVQSIIWTGYQASKKAGHEKPPFDMDSFALLADLHASPTQKFLDEHRQELSEWVQMPFRQLLSSVVTQLSPLVAKSLETKKGVFARFQKNDFGQGGAYDYYWGAFYPKGSKRTNDAQLWVAIDKNGLTFGFSIADFAIDVKKRFCAKWLIYRNQVLDLMSQKAFGEKFEVDPSLEVLSDDQKTPKHSKISDLAHWLDSPCTDNIAIKIKIDKVDVINASLEELSQRIGACFNFLFPFVLLVVSEDPIPQIQTYLEIHPPVPSEINYTLEQCAVDTGIQLVDLMMWKRAIQRKKQVILYGPPGTGKTFLAEKLAAHLTSGGDGFFELIQFHPEVSYEDFIQGIRPKALEHGGLDYPIVPGRFLEFCKRAETCHDTCVLIIDEINRANLARVFGELMYLLEYREKSVRLAAGGEFKIPNNIRIIGTMNTADRSIALVDHALRRRFAFIALYPNYDILRKFHERELTGFNVEGLISVLESLNQQIGDRHYSIGPSYFLRTDLASQIEDIWRMEIESYLDEFFFDQPDKVQQFLWTKQAEKILR
jgi:5-methylcytosine-specific restriction protein B